MRSSGIYKIQSISHPERCYIGSAVDIKDRWRKHLLGLRKNKHHSCKLQRHYNKYSKLDLNFTILCYCEKEQLIQFEQYFLDFYHPCFNSCSTAGSCLGMKHSDKTKKKLSEMNKGKSPWIKGNKFSNEHIQNLKDSHIGQIPWNKGKTGVYSETTLEKIREANRNRIISEETRKKMSEIMMGHTTSIETRKKISDAQKGNIPWIKGLHHSEEAKRKISGIVSKPIFQYDLNMIFIKEWSSAMEASKKLNLKRSGISSCLTGRYKATGGFIWKYKFNKQVA
jgi:group I intron endonuclease